MDASKITQLLQKQNTRYINRSTTVDSSTLIWQNQIKSSKIVEKTPTCIDETDTEFENACANFPTQTCCSNGNGIVNYGGQGKNATIMTGSPQLYPNPYQGSKGSGAFVYSSDVIMLQKAACFLISKISAGLIENHLKDWILPAAPYHLSILKNR